MQSARRLIRTDDRRKDQLAQASKIVGFVVCLLSFWLMLPGIANAQILLDGAFDDWRGQAGIEDAAGDCPVVDWDITRLAWAVNPGESNLFFFIERRASDRPQPVHFILRFDVNDNGRYNDPVDAYADIYYRPTGNTSHVEVELYRADGTWLSSDRGKWGESAHDGGRRLEFAIPMDRLGLSPGQSLRMYVSSPGDRVPDRGDIQWSPIPVVGTTTLSIVFLVLLALLSLSLMRRKIT